jgi:hypothetical protein
LTILTPGTEKRKQNKKRKIQDEFI